MMLVYRAPVLAIVLLGVLLAGAPNAGNADTLKLDGKTFRLDGIDAPEMDQTCLDEFGDIYPCGRIAAGLLRDFIAGRAVHCDDMGPDPQAAPGGHVNPRRRIGQCSVENTDIHRWLVKWGWALSLQPHANGRFKQEEDDARAGHFGMWRGCFVAPQDFRRWNKHAARPMGPNCPPDARARLFPDDPAMPPGCDIKGKYALRAFPFRGIYHVPGCGSYRRTLHPNRWFCSEEEAVAAGFRGSFTCGF